MIRLSWSVFLSLGLIIAGSEGWLPFIPDAVAFTLLALTSLFFGLSFLVWVYFGIRLGITTSANSHGKLVPTKRNEEPIFFYILIITYLVLGIMIVAFGGYGVLSILVGVLSTIE